MGRFIKNHLLLHPLEDGRTWRVETELHYRSQYGYDIVVPKGFCTDFASVPRFFWRLLPPWDKYGLAAIMHDWLYTKQTYPREVADTIFYEAMGDLNVPFWKRWTMYRAVRGFGWLAWQNNRKRVAGFVSLLFLLVIASGCQVIEYREGSAYFKRTSFGSRLIISELVVTVDTNGTKHIKLKGYNNDQIELIGTVAERAAAGAVGRR